MFKKINDNYEIDKFGNVRSIKNNKFLKWEITNRGYARVSLYDKKRVRWLVHRLVAKMFIGDPKNSVVNHIDNDPLNNNVDNLQICTQSKNMWFYYNEQRRHH